MITGIRGLCNGIGPALFGFVFYVFHVDLEEGEAQTVPDAMSRNHTTMQDPYGKVLKTNVQQVWRNSFESEVVDSKWLRGKTGGEGFE